MNPLLVEPFTRGMWHCKDKELCFDDNLVETFPLMAKSGWEVMGRQAAQLNIFHKAIISRNAPVCPQTVYVQSFLHFQQV